MPLTDIAALAVFAVCWLGYEPILRLLSHRSGLSAKDLTVIRAAWMREMVVRPVKLYDSNLMAHAVNTAGFFASANLLLIGAIGGAIFTGQLSMSAVKGLGITHVSSHLLHLKLGLVLVCLARGLLSFIWALRQMNYCAAAFGSIPETLEPERANDFARALSDILEPAMSNFSQGVRGYYFALASAAWLFGSYALMVAAIFAFLLLSWRASRSQSARGLHALRELLEPGHPN